MSAAVEDIDPVQVVVVEAKELTLRDGTEPFVAVAASGVRKKQHTKPLQRTSATSAAADASQLGGDRARVAVPRAAGSALSVEVCARDARRREETLGVVHIALDTLLPFNSIHDAWFSLSPAKEGGAVSGAVHLRLVRFPPRSRHALTLGKAPRAEAAFFGALERSDLFALALCLDADARLDPNVLDKHHETPLIKACRLYESESFALFLLEHPHVKVDVQNMDGNSALHICAKCFRTPTVQQVVARLIDRGADVSIRNAIGETPLHQAALNPTISALLVELLAKKGARVNEPTTRGATPLHYAVQVQKADLAALLIEYGADIDARDAKGSTPLDLCRAFGDFKLAKMLEDFKELGVYLDSIGLADFRAKFVQERLFKHKLRKLDAFDLEGLGIDPSRHQEILNHFLKLPEPEPAAAAAAGGAAGAASEPQVSGDLGSISKAYIIDENEVEFLSVLGEGTAGTVYKGKYRGMTVAIKVMLGASEAETEEFCKEFNLVSSVRSPNVIPLFGVIIGRKALTGKLCMVMECAERGSLYHYLNNAAESIGWKEALSIMDQTLKGLLALHTHNPPIMHRDLKSLNLLVTKDLRIKLCDFGLSRFNTTDNLQTLQRIRGTYAYVAPEILHKQSFTDKSDVYSLAVIFWEIVNRCITGKYMTPYEEFRETIRMDYIILTKAANQGLRPTIPPTTPTAIRNLITMCWMPKQESRPSCVALVSMLEEICVSYYRDKQLFDSCLQRSPAPST